jgi:hypothetical protein
MIARTWVVLLLVGFISISSIGVYLMVSHSTPRLKATLIEDKADLGIPGITKVYHAKLTNYGVRPVWITRCDFLDDSLTPGTELGYAVERWDAAANRWIKADYGDTDRFCKPYPLGIVEARLRGAWLLPGMSLSTNDEATAARGTTHLGDRVRFVIFTSTPGDYSHSALTNEIVIDEVPTTSQPLRIMH